MNKIALDEIILDKITLDEITLDKIILDKIILDGNILADASRIHGYLREMLKLPEHYGNNLNALFDCLTELQDTALVLMPAKEEMRETAYYKRVLRVFRDAAAQNESISCRIVDEL